MQPYKEPAYRKKIKASDLLSFRMVVRETDLWVSADKNLEKETRDLLFDCRQQLETYIRVHPEFASSLSAQPEDPFAPPIVRKMINATEALGVGPMASVAGAIAQFVGEGLLQFTDQIIVENGGDIYLKTNRPVTVLIFAGSLSLSEKLGLKIPVRQMPLGVCSSSAKVGHSLSTGVTDVCSVLSHSAAYADGAATALGNRIKNKDDLETVAAWADQIGGILGGVVIAESRIAAWGDIELVNL